MTHPHLKAVGYWRGLRSKGLPRPQWLVRPDWHIEQRTKIVNYLRSGCPWHGMLGFSFCRFHCGIGDESMGCWDFTDGEWVWPEGLAHYVEAHDVSLPEEFVATMRAHKWRVPLVGSSLPHEDAIPEYATWNAWANQHRPWYAFW